MLKHPVMKSLVAYNGSLIELMIDDDEVPQTPTYSGTGDIQV